MLVPSRYIPAAMHCSRRHLRQSWTRILSTCTPGASPGSTALPHLCLSSLPTFRLKKFWNITEKSVKLDLNLYYIYRPAVQAANWLVGVRLGYIRNYRVEVLLRVLNFGSFGTAQDAHVWIFNLVLFSSSYFYELYELPRWFLVWFWHLWNFKIQ